MNVDLGELGIHLHRPRLGWQGTACPECAMTKRRPHDAALGVEIFAEGGARWSCRRCGWKGYRRAIDRVSGHRPPSAHVALPATRSAPPANALEAAMAVWRRAATIVADTVAASYL